MLRLELPGRQALELECLLLDVNGTLTRQGRLVDGVAERIEPLRDVLGIRLLSADTFGSLDTVAAQLRVHAQVAGAADKLQALRALGAHRCVAIGNGANDVSMLEGAALGIAVLGAEGAGAAALAAADLVCSSILDALDVLRDPLALVATLRT